MINKVTLLGRVGKDPEVRHFENNGAVCNFSLATNRSYKNKNDEKVDETEWHNVVIWKRGLVTVAEKYITKGTLLYVEGRLATRSWDDQSGNKKYTTEIIVESFQMLGGKSDNGSSSTSSAPAAPATEDNSDDSDDLPF